MINKIDLHGIKHQDVAKHLDMAFYSKTFPLEVVTGKSLQMRQCVLEILNEYGLKYLELREGSIIVTE